MFDLAEKSFFECVRNLKVDSPKDYDKVYRNYEVSDLKASLIQINYTKYNNEQDLLAFDQSTDLHLQVKIHIYILDEDGDEETISSYLLVLNSNMEVVDDFLS